MQIWRDFEQQFQVHFFPVNVETNAINTLEGTSYHQEGRTVDDYLDNFWTLVSDMGYMDLQTLAVKFQQGLRLGIQTRLPPCHMDDPPTPTPMHGIEQHRGLTKHADGDQKV